MYTLNNNIHRSLRDFARGKNATRNFRDLLDRPESCRSDGRAFFFVKTFDLGKNIGPEMEIDENILFVRSGARPADDYSTR